MTDDSDQRTGNQLRLEAHGRGSSMRIANRFEQVHFESDLEQFEPDDQMAELSKKSKN